MTLILIIIVLVIVVVLVSLSLRVVKEYDRGVIFFLGKYTGVRGPGLIILIPALEQMTRVTLRPPSEDVKICSHKARVAALSMPVSTMVQPAPSSSSQRLMWSSLYGSGMRSQCTPGATSVSVPGAGGAACG